MKKLVTSYILIFLIVFLAISALFGGYGMIIDPSGESMGLPIELLEQSPFIDFLIPGLFLFFVLGIIPLFIGYGLIRKPKFNFAEKFNLYKKYHWSLTFSYYIGIILILWINMELFFMKEFHILHFVYTTLGVFIVLITNLPSTKKNYQKGGK